MSQNGRPATRAIVGRPLWVLDFGLLGHLQRVIHLDPEVPDSALEPGVPEQHLHSAEILGTAVDQGCLGASQRMGPVRCGIEADLPDPSADDSRILPRREVR